MPSSLAAITAPLLLIYRLVVRPLGGDRLRASLTAGSVALGVAVVIGIQLAAAAATESFESSVESLSGKAALTITGVGGVDERVLRSLVALPYPLRFAPRIEDFASLDGTGAAIPFIGLDLIGSSAEDWGSVEPGPAGTDVSKWPNPVLASPALGWRAGETVRLLFNDQLVRCTVAGILRSRGSTLGDAKVLAADIGLAQRLTGKTARLDAIAVTMPSYGDPAEWEQIVRSALPPGLSVERAGSRTAQNRKMLAAFRWNLTMLSYIALVVGAFLIYNAVAVSVARRRSAIGILRALGASRSTILLGILIEAAILAVAGSLPGLLLGRLLATSAVKLVGSTVESLYVSSRPGQVALTPQSMFIGLSVGVSITVLAALAPAWEASRVSAAEAMAHGRIEYLAQVRRGRHLLLGALLAAAAVIASLQPAWNGQPVFGYIAAGLAVASISVLIPTIVSSVSTVLGPVLLRLFGAAPFLALRGLRASLYRSSVLVAALTTAVGMLASVGIMVGSFRTTVALWMDSQLRADFYLRPAGTSSADRHPTIHPAVADRIEHIPGVAAVDRFRVYPIVYAGLPASLGAGETSKVQATASTFFLPGENRSAILEQLPRGDNVIVSEPFANKHHVHPGDVLRLPLGSRERPFRVLGIYYDYSTERGFVVMDRHTLLKYLPDPAASNLAVYLGSGANLKRVRDEIETAIGGGRVTLLTNSALRRNALTIFDRTFQITWSLEVIAIVVAVVGVAGALLSLVLDRKRDYAVLRILGASKQQVARMIVAEAGLLGLFANALGLVLGTVLSLILIYVVNKQSFGWTVQFHWPMALIATALTGVYAATLLAGVYPARVAMRISPIEEIHEE